MEKMINKLSGKTIDLVTEFVLQSIKDFKQTDIWQKSIKKACKATEGINDSFSDYIINSLSVQRHFLWLISNRSLDDVYRSFILTIAVELCAFNSEKRYAVSLGMAILDNWFELNEIDYRQYRNVIVGDQISEIIDNREKLYREYFLLYNDPLSKDIIRVYYPKNGEDWIEWNKNCSVDINVNLSKGTEYGFCRLGFSYTRIRESESEKFLKVAYINEDREIFRFEHDDMLGIDAEKILWVY